VNNGAYFTAEAQRKFERIAEGWIVGSLGAGALCQIQVQGCGILGDISHALVLKLVIGTT
jgi:hypothetical protein